MLTTSGMKLNQLNGRGGLKGWQWMFVVQGLVNLPSQLPNGRFVEIAQAAIFIGLMTYWWMVDFPEHAQSSFHFLNKSETELAVSRIQRDRGDAMLTPFSWKVIGRQFLDVKIYGFGINLFCLVSHVDFILERSTKLSPPEFGVYRPFVFSANNVSFPSEWFFDVIKLFLDFRAVWDSVRTKLYC